MLWLVTVNWARRVTVEVQKSLFKIGVLRFIHSYKPGFVRLSSYTNTEHFRGVSFPDRIIGGASTAVDYLAFLET